MTPALVKREAFQPLLLVSFKRFFVDFFNVTMNLGDLFNKVEK